MAHIGFDGSQEEIDEVKSYYKAKGYRTASAFLRKVVHQYMTMYAVKTQECTFSGILKEVAELKTIVNKLLKEKRQ